MTSRACGEAAAILAGGRARRLGGADKAALVVGGERILDRQLRVLRQVAGRILIVTNEPGRYHGLDVPVVPDLGAGAGALGGIYSALVAADADRTLVIACDMPFLTAPFLRHVLDAGRDADVALPRGAGGYEPLCACYARAAVDPIRRRIEAGDLKASDPTAGLRIREIGPDEIAPFDPDATLFLNVNTADDYAAAVARLNRKNR